MYVNAQLSVSVRCLFSCRKNQAVNPFIKKIRETRWTGCHFRRDINKQAEVAKLSLRVTRRAQVAEDTTHKPHRRYLLVCDNEYCQTDSWNISKKKKKKSFWCECDLRLLCDKFYKNRFTFLNCFWRMLGWKICVQLTGGHLEKAD